MTHRADLVSFQTYDAEIDNLFELLTSHGIDTPAESNIVKDAYAAFQLLYYHVFAGERPSDLEGLYYARVQAGLGDISAKINKHPVLIPRRHQGYSITEHNGLGWPRPLQQYLLVMVVW